MFCSHLLIFCGVIVRLSSNRNCQKKNRKIGIFSPKNRKKIGIFCGKIGIFIPIIKTCIATLTNYVFHI